MCNTARWHGLLAQPPHHTTAVVQSLGLVEFSVVDGFDRTGSCMESAHKVPGQAPTVTLPVGKCSPRFTQ